MVARFSGPSILLVAFCIQLANKACAVAEGHSVPGTESVSRGMDAFKRGFIEASIQHFDEALAFGYPMASLWQRGLSLYYARRFGDCAAQFRRDLDRNLNDVEEAIWAMMCEAQTEGFDVARAKIAKVGHDRRLVMRMAYKLFKGSELSEIPRLDLTATSQGDGTDAFFAALYLGLFAEAQGNDGESMHWFDVALDTEYAKTVGDYMVDVARVHAKLRGWKLRGWPVDATSVDSSEPGTLRAEL